MGLALMLGDREQGCVPGETAHARRIVDGQSQIIADRRARDTFVPILMKNRIPIPDQADLAQGRHAGKNYQQADERSDAIFHVAPRAARNRTESESRIADARQPSLA